MKSENYSIKETKEGLNVEEGENQAEEVRLETKKTIQVLVIIKE